MAASHQGALTTMVGVPPATTNFLTAITIQGNTISPTNCSVLLTLNTNGTITLAGGNITSTGTGWDTGGGVVPTWVRYTNTSGTAPNNGNLVPGVWTRLNVAQGLGNQTVAAGAINSSGTLELSSSATGSPVTASVSCTLIATRT